MRIYKSLKNNNLVAGIFGGLIVSLSAVTTPALAHDTFLLPAKNIWTVGNSVDIGLSSTLSFPDLTWGVKQDRISATVIRVGGETVETFSLTDGEAFLNLGFVADRSGFGVVALSTKPRFGDIAPDKVEGYLDEIGATSSVRQAFAALPGEPSLHRSYAKHSKTFICVEDCVAGSATSATPVGQDLEFIAGGGFIASGGGANVFQLLRGGKPLAHHKVKVTTSAKEGHEITTTGSGELTISGKISGVIMLRAVVITLPDQAEGVYHSDYATLVVDITRAP